MRLTVLGSGAACAPAGGNSSGYLIQDHHDLLDANLLLDCGHGIASALLQRLHPTQLHHIFISHMHVDHFIDLIPLRFAISKDMRGIADPAGTLWLPPGGRDCLAQILDAICFPADFLDNVWQVGEYGPHSDLSLAPGLTARFAMGVHYIPGWAMQINGSASICYTGDTAPCEPVAQLAAGSDLLLAEATLDEPESGPVRGHLTPKQAADLARDANVSQLLLTHFWHDADRDAIQHEAQRHFTGPVGIAHDGLVLDLPARAPQPPRRHSTLGDI